MPDLATLCREFNARGRTSQGVRDFLRDNPGTEQCSRCDSVAPSHRVYDIIVEDPDSYDDEDINYIEGEYDDLPTVRWCSGCRSSHAYSHSDGRLHDVEEETGGISAYHSGDRDSLFDGVDLLNPGLLGVELETYLPRRGHILSKLRRELAGHKFFAEQDGSLCGRCGCEFVFAPDTLENLIHPQSVLMRLAAICQRSGGTAWNAGTGYGMHISVNARGMTELHCSKFLTFINGNDTFFTKYAGRSPNQWARFHYAFGSRTPRPSAEMTDKEKYRAAAARSRGRIEVRIFRATLNTERLARNCELVDAVRIWTKDVPISGLDTASFMSWLASPINKKRYPLLRKFSGIKGGRIDREAAAAVSGDSE